MKLVIDLLGFEHGKSYGFEEYMMNLLNDFVTYRDNIKVDHVIVVCHKSQEDFIKATCKNVIEVYTIEFKGVVDRILRSGRIPKELGLSKEDVILYPRNTMPLASKKTNTILTVHDLLYTHGEFCAKTLYFRLYRLHKYVYLPQSVRKSDRVVAISQCDKDEIVEHFGCMDKISVIYNYFNFGKYSDGSARTIRDIDSPFILTVCANSEHKNHVTFLKAFSVFAQEYPDYKMCIVGGLSQTAHLYYDSMPQELKNRMLIVKHISNSDFAYLYSHAKAYISASLYEGLGMPVVEGMYFGLPVVLSNLSIHREVSFDKGIYCEPFDYESYAKGLKEAIEKPIDPSIKRIIKEKYNTDNTSMKYIEEVNKFAKA